MTKFFLGLGFHNIMNMVGDIIWIY